MRAPSVLLQAACRSSRPASRAFASASSLPSGIAAASTSTAHRLSTYIPRIPLQQTQPRASRYYATSAPIMPEKAFDEPETPPVDPRNTFDIVIIGGANAGLALACALLSHHSIRTTTRILLLEGGSLDKVRSWSGEGTWENRVSSLTAENVAWLREIGVWQHIVSSRSKPVEEMIIWSNPPSSSVLPSSASAPAADCPTIHFPPLGHPMAYMTENVNLQQALMKRISEIGGEALEIREMEKGRVGEMVLAKGGQSVGLKVGDEWVRGSVVIGADGPNSPVRRFSNISSYSHPYPTHAVVATLNHRPPAPYTNNTAFQRFLPTGPLAFLPLSEEASTMVWSTQPELAATLKRLPNDSLVRMVNYGFTLPEPLLETLHAAILTADTAGSPLTPDQMASTLAVLPTSALQASASNAPSIPYITAIPPESVASFPLRLSHADAYLGPRTVLVGDAAHTLHPLAGQGLNMGLADVRSLAAVLARARELGGDLGAEQDLLAYPRERYSANHLMLSATDKLNAIFRSRNPLVNWARGTGLEVINELAGVKKVLMENAGARVGKRARTMEEREWGVRGAGTQATGWPVSAAQGLENWLAFKQIAGAAGALAKEGLKNGLRRAADALDSRRG